MGEIIVGGQTVLFDEEDRETVYKHAWFLTPQGYACTKIRRDDGSRRTIGMHRVILGDPPTPSIDHINRNKRDNRKANLRACTDSENSRNQDFSVIRRKGSSKYWGVSFNKRGHWQVVVKIKGRAQHFGVFHSEEVAVEKAKEVYRKIYGDAAAYEISPKEQPEKKRRVYKFAGYGI